MRRRRGRARRTARGHAIPSLPEEILSAIDSDLAWLQEAVHPYSIEIDREALERLRFFASETVTWNDRLNLLSRADVYNVVRKHVAASLGVLLVARPTVGERWIDVGTGGGFPGLVLRLVDPEAEITLLDSARKRCVFVEEVLRKLGCRNVPVLAMRAETHLAQGEGRAGYAVMTTRAVASLRDALEGFGPLLRPRGRLVTFKGPSWANELEQARTSGVLDLTGFEFVSATRIPWTNGHVLLLRRSAEDRFDAEHTNTVR